MTEHQFVGESEARISDRATNSAKQSLTAGYAIFWGGLIAAVLDAADGVIAFGTEGLNPVQVLQYIASGALGHSAFQGGVATAAVGAVFHFLIAWVAAAVFVFASQWIRALKTQAVPFGLLYGVSVYFFMNYLVLPLSAVAPSPFHIVFGAIG